MCVCMNTLYAFRNCRSDPDPNLHGFRITGCPKFHAPGIQRKCAITQPSFQLYVKVLDKKTAVEWAIALHSKIQLLFKLGLKLQEFVIAKLLKAP